MYQPRFDPPKWWERFLVLRNEIILLVWSFIAGVLTIIDPLHTSITFSLSIGDQEPIVAFIIGLLYIIGAILTYFGLQRMCDNQSLLWGLEKAGWLLIAAGWITKSVVVLATFPTSTISWGMGFVFALMALTRIATLTAMERNTRYLKRVTDTGELRKAPTLD